MMTPFWMQPSEPEQPPVSGLWDSIVSWFQGSTDTIMRQFELYKAKLYTAIGNLLGMRETILNMQDRANNLVIHAQQTNNPVAMSAARNLKVQIDAAYQEQLDTERKVSQANAQINAIDQGTGGSGLGVAPLIPIAAIAGAVAVVAAAIAAITIHTQRVNYLKRALDDLETKLLTPGEYQAATMGIGGSPFDFFSQLGTLGKVALAGGAVYVGYQIYLGMKRGRR